MIVIGMRRDKCAVRPRLPVFPGDHTRSPLLRWLHFVRSIVEGTRRRHSLEGKFHEREAKPPGSEIRRLATETTHLMASERLLKEYLDKRTTQFGI
jgi:hypothetical protein